jgi:hypothetical protein
MKKPEKYMACYKSGPEYSERLDEIEKAPHILEAAQGVGYEPLR